MSSLTVRATITTEPATEPAFDPAGTWRSTTLATVQAGDDTVAIKLAGWTDDQPILFLDRLDGDKFRELLAFNDADQAERFFLAGLVAVATARAGR